MTSHRVLPAPPRAAKGARLGLTSDSDQLSGDRPNPPPLDDEDDPPKDEPLEY